MALSLPYSHLNLYRNPFGELNRTKRQEIAVSSSHGLVERLRSPGFAVQFIGVKGSGKTSHLLALRRYFSSAPYVHIGEGEQPDVPLGTPLFIDEVQRLKKHRRKKVFRRKASFVIATHVDLRHEFRCFGVAVHTIHPGKILNAVLLALIFKGRIDQVRRGPGPVPTIRPGTVQALMDQYGDDVRRMEDNLYEQFQCLKRVTDV